MSYDVPTSRKTKSNDEETQDLAEVEQLLSSPAPSETTDDIENELNEVEDLLTPTHEPSDDEKEDRSDKQTKPPNDDTTLPQERRCTCHSCAHSDGSPYRWNKEQVHPNTICEHCIASPVYLRMRGAEKLPDITILKADGVKGDKKEHGRLEPLPLDAK